jgi:hypothetical protein
MSSTFVLVVGRAFRTTIMPELNAIGAGVGAVVGVISGLFKSKKMKKEARTLTGEQDRMHLHLHL